jgi:hypothetical protein
MKDRIFVYGDNPIIAENKKDWKARYYKNLHHIGIGWSLPNVMEPILKEHNISYHTQIPYNTGTQSEKTEEIKDMGNFQNVGTQTYEIKEKSEMETQTDTKTDMKTVGTQYKNNKEYEVTVSKDVIRYFKKYI